VTETILIVDDEDGVRRTFREWLATLPEVRVLAVADAEEALLLANAEPIDLAVLDWNLGSGSDGLRLLEDLVEFQPHLVAILVTGFANKATPLDAMRMGVRDYLDKNQDLTRESFLRAVRKQLDAILPAKRQRMVERTLREFREAVEQILPLVRGAAALNDTQPVGEGVRQLLGLAKHLTNATGTVLLVRQGGTVTAFDADGQPVALPAVPFAQTLAASVVSQQQVCVIRDFGEAAGAVTMFPFEKDHQSILAAPMEFGPGAQAVLELFDVSDESAARRIVAPLAAVGAELLRHSFHDRQTNRLLFDAVDAALKAGEDVSASFRSGEVMDRLRSGLASSGQSPQEAEAGLKLVEAVRSLTAKYGQPAIDHGLRMVESTRRLLEETQG
jgi:two-component system, NtrC family, nitrogen regulation response regulator NtrX